MTDDDPYSRLFAGEDGSVLGKFREKAVRAKLARAETRAGLIGELWSEVVF